MILGRAKGRQRSEDITLCDLTGTGVQDTAIATHVRQSHPGIGSLIRA